MVKSDLKNDTAVFSLYQNNLKDRNDAKNSVL